MKKDKNMNKKSPVAAFCSALGTVLLILLILACIPFTLPKALGYQAYTVISGSMEPAIPVGSIVYIKEMKPENVVEGDVIAFYGGRDSNAMITHRVVENRVIMGEFITKGDANESTDMNPINYDEFIGRVEFDLPWVGIVAQFLTSMEGKIAAGCMIGLAIVLHLLAAVFENNKKRIIS